jgi:hypothetical protein
MRVPFVCLMLLVLLSSCSSTAQDQPALSLRSPGALTNQDIVAMLRGKFSDAVIIKTIQAIRTGYDISVPGLLQLKYAGADDRVIDAVLSADENRKRDDPAAVPIEPNKFPTGGNSDLPDDVGVYLKQPAKLMSIEPEIVNWRTGGVLKAVVTAGLDKGHLNGSVPGPHSALMLSWNRQGLGGPLEFYIRCQEGNSASEYQLLRLWDKGNRREFRSVTGGILHRSGGAQLNEVGYTYEKVAPRIYTIQNVRLDAGEYWFLAPGAAGSSNLASYGKIYTFRVPV